jgi:hypothetical protein
LEPFNLPADGVTAALEEMAEVDSYRDIQSVCASDGSRFLFSTRGLEPVRARSLAEWIAVDQFDNP